MPDTHDKKDLAIIGLGPAGLACALIAASHGYSVIGIGNRQDYVRSQRVIINSDTKNLLKPYLNTSNQEDVLFDNQMRTGTVQIKDLERFLYKKIEQYTGAHLVILDKNETYHFSQENNKHFVTFPTKYGSETCPFHHLLAADGIKHHTANEVQQVFNKEITYIKTLYQPRHLYHGAVQLQLAKPNMPSLEPVKPEIQAQRKIKSGLRWIQSGWDMTKMNDMPKCYIIPNETRTKFSFAGEIPAHIYRETNEEIRKEQLKQWAAWAIYHEYGIEHEQLEFKISKKYPESYEKIKATSFLMEIYVCKEPCIYLHDDEKAGVFAQIGDARRTPNYRIGHGVNDAIECAALFVGCMDRNTGTFNDKKYAAMIQNIDRRIDDEIQNEEQRVENRVKISKKMIAKAITPLISILETHQVNARPLFDSVKEGGFSFSNLIKVMNKVEEILLELTNLTHEEQQQIHEKMHAVREAMTGYSESTSSVVKEDESLNTLPTPSV